MIQGLGLLVRVHICPLHEILLSIECIVDPIPQGFKVAVALPDVLTKVSFLLVGHTLPEFFDGF
jgi:hypothetical protein